MIIIKLQNCEYCNRTVPNVLLNFFCNRDLNKNPFIESRVDCLSFGFLVYLGLSIRSIAACRKSLPEFVKEWCSSNENSQTVYQIPDSCNFDSVIFNTCLEKIASLRSNYLTCNLYILIK